MIPSVQRVGGRGVAAGVLASSLAPVTLAAHEESPWASWDQAFGL